MNGSIPGGQPGAETEVFVSAAVEQCAYALVVDWRGEDLLREADGGVRPFASIRRVGREGRQVDAMYVHAELPVEEECGTG